VESLALQHLIQHLLSTVPAIKVLIRRRRGGNLARAVRRSLPDVVVANARLSRVHAGETVAAIKGSSPGLKLIMICSVGGFERDVLKCGADACLAEETLVRQLMPTLFLLSCSREERDPHRRGRVESTSGNTVPNCAG
jgi:chemotaxis response regulator CheB